MSQTPTSAGRHPSNHEQDLAVAIVLWIMLAGFCVVAANAWASGWVPLA